MDMSYWKCTNCGMSVEMPRELDLDVPEPCPECGGLLVQVY